MATKMSQPGAPSETGKKNLVALHLNDAVTDKKSDLRYLEQWDLTTLMSEYVDIPNSQASFNIPLVDHPISKGLQITLSAAYNSGEAKTNGLLGNGWSLQLPEDYIILDQKETTFSKEYEYYLMINTQMEKLVRIPSTDDNDNLQHFQLAEKEDISITYDPADERWVIDTKNLRAVYGHSEDNTTNNNEAVQKSLFWESWRGPGRGDRDKLKPQVQAWYVISREEKHGQKQKLLYEYHIEQASLSNGMNYTSSIQLKTIRDGVGSTQLNLLYGSKSRDEYVVQNPQKAENYLQFPVFLQSNKFLEGYRLVTEKFQQEISFEYNVQNDKVRKLIDIRQEYSALDLSETLFEFSYDQNLHHLVELKRGNDKSIKYLYSQLQIPTLNFGSEKNSIKHLVTEGVQVSQSTDFTAMAYHINTNILYIKVANRQLTSVVNTLEASDGDMSDPKNHIEDFALLTFPNLIAVFVETPSTRFLSTFHRNLDSQEWATTPQKTRFQKGEIFRYSENIMAVAKNTTGQITIFEPNEKDLVRGVKSSTISLSGGALHRFIIQNRVILAYDGSELFTLTKEKVDDEKGWQKTSIMSVSSTEEEFIRDVFMDQDFAKYFKDQMRINGLQMIKNMVLLNVVKWVQNKLSCKVHLFLLDDQYKLALSQEFYPGDDKQDKLISQFVKEQNATDEKGTNILKFRYERVDSNKWQSKLFSISGQIDKDIEKMCRDAKPPCTSQDKLDFKRNQTIDFNRENESDLRKMLLFDPSPCLHFQLDSKGANTNSSLIRMQGSSWLQEGKKHEGGEESAPVLTNMELSKDFILESKQSTNDTVFRLFKQNLVDGSKIGGVLEEFKISSNGSMAVGYPSYLAFQEEPWKEYEIIPLKEGGSTGQRLKLMQTEGEQLMRMSNAETILSLRPVRDPSLFPFTHEVISHRVNTLIASEPTFVLQKTEVKDGENGGAIRVRTYENSFVSNKETLSQENSVKVIPTGDPNYSGFYEETTVIPVDEPSAATKTVKWVDADRKVVRSKTVEFSDQDDELEDEAGKPDYKIYDISGDFEISQLFPYNRTHQMVSYFGFESYENPELSGTTSKWSFETGEIVRDGDSFSGKSFLRLRDGQKLVSTLEPKDQSGTYVASTWVRFSSEEQFQFEAPVPYFKANLVTSQGLSFVGLFGQMKRQRDNWLYLEATVDLHKIRNNLYAEYFELNKNSHENSLEPPNSVNFTVSIELDSGKHFENVIEIDHVRFLPIQADLRMKVFDEKSGAEVAAILPNGAVIRKIYNAYGQEIANVDENGQIEQLISVTHSGEIFPVPNYSRSGGVSGLLGLKSEVIIKPESGTYEQIEFACGKWATDDEKGWKISNWEVSHLNSNLSSELRAIQVEKLFDPSSAAVRLHINLDSEVGSKIVFNLAGIPLLEFKTDEKQIHLTSILTLASSGEISNLPTSGELIIFVDNSTVWVWFDTNLLFEQKMTVPFPLDQPWSQFSLRVEGPLKISNFMILNCPQVFQEFFNGFGDRTQIIKIESEDSVLLSEIIYDEIGREAIKTKTGRITKNTHGRSTSSPLFTFHHNFATNKNPQDYNSVFKTGILEGLVSQVNPQDEGFSYTRTIFMKDLLQEAEVDGLPGSDFSIRGSFTKQHSRDSRIPFMRNLFPPENGFKEKVTHEPNGSLKVSIIDKREQEIAHYVRVPGSDNILTTFEYDEDGNLLKILPPAYHQQVDTFSRSTPLPIGNGGLLTENERFWQEKLGTHFKYDDRNYLTMKKAPDTGLQEYKYDILGNMRFMYSIDIDSQNNNNTIAKNIVYLLHAGKNQPVEIGYLPTPMKVEELVGFVNSTSIPNQVVHQRIIHSDSHSDPDVRGKVKLFLTYTTEKELGLSSTQNIPPPHQELIKFDSENHVVLKTSNAVHSKTLTNLHKHYKRGKISELQYPKGGEGAERDMSALNLIHTYDKVAHLTGLGTRENPNKFAKFSYSSSGQIMEEVIEPGTSSQFTRRYHYNSPGLLVEITDQFLSQNLAFIDEGYGQRGFGDGIIMKTGFNASWTDIDSLVDSTNFQKWFRIPEEEFADNKIKTMCVSALKRLNFVDPLTAIPLRFLSHADLSSLPLACSADLGHELMKMIAEKHPPSKFYGHLYAYGNHQELTKAKYFNDDRDNLYPLQVHTFFKEIPEIESQAVSEQIWDLLTESGHIITDNRRREDKTAAIGKEGTKPIFCYDKLSSDLEQVSPLAFAYTRPIIHLLFDKILKNEAVIDEEGFKETYVVWLGYRDTPTATLIINRAKNDAKKIYDMLSAKGYLSGNVVSLLDQNFAQLLSPFSNNALTQIVGVLRSHFTTQIGLTVNDYEAYSIDSNGNQKTFFVGLTRHTLDYSGSSSNQVSKLSVYDPYALPGEPSAKVYELEHDSLGNISKAPHRNIREIRYHPVTNRPVYVELSDGRKIIFQYDAQGERVLKRVYDSKEVLLSEVKYLRDERGNVLMDTRTEFGQNEAKITTTSTYLHGPRGLLGFIRNGKFYSVFTDHAGSIRLVSQGGKVVAGYDYSPYGELMRVFGEPEDHIHYRFTGQEYDEETGLYNFHARIYDPMMGRFYQPDPKSQYYSPYIYGGNSPVSLVDPDGELFLTIMAIIGAVVGAYLGAAAANGSFNPLKWDWKNINTYIGMATGAIAGAALPGGFAALAGSIGVPGAILVGLGGSFMSMAIENKSWNPTKWDWTSPATYNAFYQGFGEGMKFGNSVAKVGKIASTLGKTGQIVFIAKSYGLGFTLGYVQGAMANGKNFNFLEWDFSDPNTLAAIKSGFTSGLGLPQKSTNYAKVFGKFIWKDERVKEIVKTMQTSTMEMFKEILKDKNHPLYKSVGKGLLNHMMVSIDQGSNFDITKWDWKSLSTYEGFLNGIMEATEILQMVGEYREGNLKIDKAEIFNNLSAKKQLVGGFLSEVQKGLAQLSQFYLPKNSGKQARNGEIPIAYRLLMGLVDDLPPQISRESEDSNGYGEELKKLLEGMSSAGSKIFPDLNFGNYIDCHKDVHLYGNLEFESCDISQNSGKTQRQNRELVNKLFVPSAKYQSKNEFMQVLSNPQNSTEFLDHFVTLTEDLGVNSEEFLHNYFLGATANSLLNYLKGNTTGSGLGNVFIRSELVESLNLRILHIGFLSNSKFSVRVVAIGGPEHFDVVANHIKQQKYRCQLSPQIGEKINEIETQIYLIQLGLDGESSKPKVFTMTPEMSLEQGEFPELPKLVQVAPVAGASSILTNFEAFIQETENETGENVNLFEQFTMNVKEIFENTREFMETGDNNQSLIGFFYGLLHCNMKNAYHLLLKLGESNSLAILARRNTQGNENLQSTPVIIKSGDNFEEIERSLNFFSSLTLSKNAVLLNVDRSQSVSSVNMPQFGGFFDEINNGTLTGSQNAIKTLFYRHLEGNSYFEGDKQLQGGGNLHYLSNFILGEFLAQANYVTENQFDIYVFSPPTGNSYSSRLASQRIFFLKNRETGNCTILNVIESSMQVGVGSSPVFNPSIPTDIPAIPIPLNELGAGSLRHLKVKLNINSIQGFGDFFQGIEETFETNPSKFPFDSASYFNLKSEVVDSFQRLSFDPHTIQSIFKLLSENRFKALVSSETDFQSLASGFFMGMSNYAKTDVDGMQLALRYRLSDKKPIIEEHSFVTLSKENLVVPQSQQLLLNSLKFAYAPNEVDIKFTQAAQEINEQVCKNEEMLSEFWKVSTASAVYGPELPDAIKFETGWSSNEECEISPTNQNQTRMFFENNFLRNFAPESKSSSSSASKASLNILPFNVMKFITRGFSTVSNLIFEGEKKSSSSKFSSSQSKTADSKLKQKWSHGNTENCQIGAWVDNSYSMDGITCLGEKSKMSVFSVVGPNDVMINHHQDGHHNSLVGDTYDKESCVPLEFHGKPSVTCKGKKTNLVYTPYLQERMFDNLDSNLMLGRILLHLGVKLFNPSSLTDDETFYEAAEKVFVTEDMVEIMERRLDKIEALLGSDFVKESGVEWALAQLKDCKETLKDLSKRVNEFVGKLEVESLRERLTALYEDVVEQIELVRENKGEKSNKDRENKGKDNERNTWDTNVSEDVFQTFSANEYISQHIQSNGHIYKVGNAFNSLI